MIYTTMSAFLLLVVLDVVAVVTGDPIKQIPESSVGSDGEYYLYQASLRHIESDQHFCSGSVIQPNWILTAAHCVYKNKTSSMYVVVATKSLISDGVSFFVSKIVTHEQYNPTKFANDIALLRLEGFITFNNKVQPISISRTFAPGGINCILTRWGSSNLQHITLKTMWISQCKNELTALPVSNTHICTYVNTNYSVSRGNSGSPLVVEGVQIGIASWGILCKHRSIDVFTSVAWYRNWIRIITTK